MKKKLNTELIANELKGGSAFFPDYQNKELSPLQEDKSQEDHKMLNINLPSLLKGTENNDLHANQQTGKEESMQTGLPESMLSGISEKLQTGKHVNLLTTKEKRKYSTYLSEESVDRVKILAVQTKRKDHEIIQEAVDEYLQKHK